VTRFPAWLLVLLTTAPAFADNWPQWRGPKNDGTSAETGLPTEWGPDKNLVWKVKLPGVGSSTPCIWGDHIFLTAQDGTDVALLCLGTDGQERWRKVVGFGEFFTRGDEGGNLATPSPSTDGKQVYVFVGSGLLAAFDFSGKQVWGVNLSDKYGKFVADRKVIQFGAHWTPVLDGGKVYQVLMHRKAQEILCFDAATGEELWQRSRASDSRPGTESPDVYASPFVWRNGDRSALIVHGNDYCTAHDLANGRELWRVTGLNPKERYNRAWRAVSSPLVTPDLIVVPSCKDGVTVGVDPLKASGEVAPGTPGELWRMPKGTPDVPSPVRVGDVVYLWREKELLTAVDARTGAELYSERLTNTRHRANPVAADGKLYLVGREGDMPVVKAGRAFELVAKNKLPDTFTASPAVSGGRLYFRGWDYLWAVGAK
jgi:outer membrane protein assembly factor BamB